MCVLVVLSLAWCDVREVDFLMLLCAIPGTLLASLVDGFGESLECCLERTDNWIKVKLRLKKKEK